MKRQEPAGAIEGAELERVIELLKKHGPPPRRKPTKSQPYTDQDFAAADTQFRLAMAGRRAAADFLANPVVTRQELLDKPILIWQYPNPQSDIFLDSNIESMNSLVRFRYFAYQGINTSFAFCFLWTNRNASPAVINIDSQMVFTGSCHASARSGVIFGYRTEISLSTAILVRKNTGWESEGSHLLPTQESQRNAVTSFSAEGGSGLLFQGPGTASESFAAQPFDFSFNSFLVPAGASVIVTPTLYLSCSVEGSTLNDSVDVDFGRNGHAVRCPFVALTIQTET